MFLALPPVEMEWPQRLALAAASGANEVVSYDDLLRAAATGKFAPLLRAVPVRLGRGAPGGCASAPRARRSRPPPPAHPARPRSNSASRRSGAARPRRRWCVGTDASVNPESLIRFSLLSALSTRNDPPQAAARPFSKDRDGFVMAEGAGALVLESLAHARARGAKILGVVEGCGEMADGFHRTRSSPDGKPIIACMRNALEDAGLAPDAIGYINAHGTGTPENDKMEWVGVSAVFGERAGAIPISSNKSMIGHTLTAAGTVEAIFTLLTMRHGRAAADHQLRDARSDAASRLRAQRRARRAGAACDFQFVRVRRAECVPGDGTAVRVTALTANRARCNCWPTASSP